MTARLLAAAACCLAVLACAAPAHGAAQLAVQDDQVFLYRGYGDREQAFARAAQLHASWIRFNVIWGSYVAAGRSLAMYDDAVDAARAHGLRVQMTITGTPRYASAQDQSLSWQRPDPGRMRQFAGLVAAHFKGRVSRYSIWNEPNISIWLARSAAAPRQYRALHRAGYEAVKAADPSAQVLFGELASGQDALGFLAKAAAPGAGLSADGLAYHPFQFYAFPGAPDSAYAGISNLARVQAALRHAAAARGLRTPSGGALPVYYTEFGYLRRGIYTMGETRRSQWAYAACQLVARQPAVKELLWYQLVTAPVSQTLWDSSLLSGSGRPYRTFSAIAAATRSWPQA